MGVYLRHPASLSHDTGSHPENADRIRAIEAKLEGVGWLGLDVIEAPPAQRSWLERVHEPGLVDAIEAICAAGGGAIDADTIVSKGSWEAALRAAGAAAEGARLLLAGESDFAFCGLRPPGHHAESDHAMGFCLFNNAAVGAAHAIAECGAERVLIFDWDVHHGNGTEQIFAARDDVLYVSIHQSPFYPGTGAASETGHGRGAGFTINLPVAAGAGDAEFIGMTEHVVLPAARNFRPDLILVSAGYDAHSGDPLADCRVSTDGYAAMTAHVRELGSELDAPVMVCLEGGYDPTVLADCALATIEALGGDQAPTSVEPVAAVAAAAQRAFV